MNFGHVALSLLRSCEFLSSEPGAVWFCVSHVVFSSNEMPYSDCGPLASYALFDCLLTFHCSVLVFEILLENIWQAYVECGFLCFLLGAEEVTRESHVSQPLGLSPRMGSAKNGGPESALSVPQRPQFCSSTGCVFKIES